MKNIKNIVWILTDSQHAEAVGYMGNKAVHTPNLDKLAAQSLRFPNAYLPSSVCRPSLVTLLTGLYPHEHGVFFNHGPPGNAGYSRMESADERRLVMSHPHAATSAAGRCLDDHGESDL